MTNTPMTPDREQLIRERLASTLKPQKAEIADLLAELDRLRAALSDAADQVAERDDELGGVHTELDRLRREIRHHQDGKARWRSRAEKAEARVAELAGRPVEAHVLRQAAAQVEDDHPEAAAALYKAANVAEHAAAQRPWQDDDLAEGLAGLDAMRADHPAPCRVPDSPDCTCPASEAS